MTRDRLVNLALVLAYVAGLIVVALDVYIWRP